MPRKKFRSTSLMPHRRLLWRNTAYPTNLKNLIFSPLMPIALATLQTGRSLGLLSIASTAHLSTSTQCKSSTTPISQHKNVHFFVMLSQTYCPTVGVDQVVCLREGNWFFLSNKVTDFWGFQKTYLQVPISFNCDPSRAV